MDIKKIDWRKPKYILPVIAVAAGLFIAYNVAELMKEKPQEDDGLERMDEFNANLPEVNTQKVGIRSKMEEMRSNLELGKGYTAVENVDREQEKKENVESVYSEQEQRVFDSLDEVRKRQLREVQNRIEAQRNFNIQGNTTPAVADNPQMEAYTRQIQMIQKLQRGEKIMTPEEEEREKAIQTEKQIRQAILDSIALAQAPALVTRAETAGERAFNTVEKGNETTELIKARVDEMVKVKDGSRLRIRLSEDVDIDGVRVKAGTNLYANVAGFSAQRVKAEITSVVLGGKLREINLSVYDIDGQEGFFVPTSAFRDLAKEAGASAMQMNMNINSSGGGQTVEGMAMQTLQQTLQSITSAASSNIKKNRAKIKYNTEIYLVDMNSKSK